MGAEPHFYSAAERGCGRDSGKTCGCGQIYVINIHEIRSFQSDLLGWLLGQRDRSLRVVQIASSPSQASYAVLHERTKDEELLVVVAMTTGCLDIWLRILL